MNVPYLFLPFQDLGTVLECAPKLAAHSNITEKISQISPSLISRHTCTKHEHLYSLGWQTGVQHFLCFCEDQKNHSLVSYPSWATLSSRTFDNPHITGLPLGKPLRDYSNSIIPERWSPSTFQHTYTSAFVKYAHILLSANKLWHAWRELPHRATLDPMYGVFLPGFINWLDDTVQCLGPMPPAGREACSSLCSSARYRVPKETIVRLNMLSRQAPTLSLRPELWFAFSSPPYYCSFRSSASGRHISLVYGAFSLVGP